MKRVVFTVIIALCVSSNAQAMMMLMGAGVRSVLEMANGAPVSDEDIRKNLLDPQCQQEIEERRDYLTTGPGRNYKNWWESPRYARPDGQHEGLFQAMRRLGKGYSECERSYRWWKQACRNGAHFSYGTKNFGRDENCNVPLEQQPWWGKTEWTEEMNP